MKSPVISIVIITKNDPGVSVTLDGLTKLKLPAPTEVIVVDGSVPQTALRDIREQHSSVRWIYYNTTASHKRTFSEQRNTGVQHAKGQYIVFIDGDCTPEPNWLQKLYETLQQPRTVVASQLLSTGRDSAFGLAASHEGLVDVNEAAANGLGMERALFGEIGPFDERITYGEDTDITWRARLAGYRIVWNTDAIIHHEWGSKRSDMKRAFRYGSARAKLYKKHPGLWRQLLGHDLNVLVYGLFLAFLPVMLLAFWHPIFLLYPLILLIPMLKNFRQKPLLITATNLVYGAGVIVGCIKPGLAV